MEIGVCVASKIDDIGYVVRAEELGYSHAWFADSQMIWSDPYACLALAADRTSTIRLGTGVAVAATRPAPVAASSIATINRLAPGRTFFGVGTGNTAMRIMGHKPMRITEFEEYLRVVRPLLRGDEIDYEWRGERSLVRHIMADGGFVDFEHPIPVHVSGFGPRSLALAGQYGDGAVVSIPPTTRAMQRVWGAIEAGATAVGRTLDRSEFHTCSLTTIVVLDPGETVDSPRVKEQAGAFAIAGLHYGYDQQRNFGRRPGGPVAEHWDDYTEMLSEFDPDRVHQRVHAGHNCWVVPDEERFVTPDLITNSCIVGTADQVVDRLGELGDAGLDQVMILPPFDPRYEVLERVGADIIPQLS